MNAFLQQLPFAALLLAAVVIGNLLTDELRKVRAIFRIKADHAKMERQVRASRPPVKKVGTIERLEDHFRLHDWEFDFSGTGFIPAHFVCRDGTVLTLGYTADEIEQMAANPGEWQA